MPRSMASGAKRFMSPEPDPSRTTSFSRSMTSNRLFPVGRAMTRWNELVPMSMAASGADPFSVRGTGRRLRRRSRFETDRQRLQGVVEVRPLPARLTDQLDAVEPLEELFEEHPTFEAGQVHTEAEVLGDSKGKVWVGITPDVERVRIGEHVFVAVGTCVDHRHLVARGDRLVADDRVLRGRAPEVVQRI